MYLLFWTSITLHVYFILNNVCPVVADGTSPVVASIQTKTLKRNDIMRLRPIKHVVQMTKMRLKQNEHFVKKTKTKYIVKCLPETLIPYSVYMHNSLKRQHPLHVSNSWTVHLMITFTVTMLYIRATVKQDVIKHNKTPNWLTTCQVSIQTNFSQPSPVLVWCCEDPQIGNFLPACSERH